MYPLRSHDGVTLALEAALVCSGRSRQSRLSPRGSQFRVEDLGFRV